MKAIVVGATSGIGLEVARLLAREGWEVGIAGRREDRLEEIKSSEPGIVASRRIDVCSDDAASLMLSLAEEMGGMDLYFHSSGIGWQNLLLDEEREVKTAMTNCVGFTRMVDAAYQYFARQRHGHIAVISSIAGTKGLGAAPAYSATKRFQNHYMQCLRQNNAMRGLGIRLTDIRPGFVDTDLISNSSYPLKLSPVSVARQIVKAIRREQKVVVIDWRYRLLVGLWRLVPVCVWERMKIK